MTEIILPQSCQTLFYLVFPIWFKMLGLTLLMKARTAPSWLFWLSVTILIFGLHPIFPHTLTHLSVYTIFGLLNGKGGMSSSSLSCREIFVWGWHYLAVELWHKVAFDHLEPCSSFCSSPLCTHLYCEGKGELLLLLLFFSSHTHLSSLCVMFLDLWNCHFPWRCPSTPLASHQHLGLLLCHPELCTTVHLLAGVAAFV